MLKNKVMFLVPGLLLGVSTFAAPKTPAPKVPAGSPDFTVRRDHVGRQEVLRNTDAEVAHEVLQLRQQGGTLTAGLTGHAQPHYQRALERLRFLSDLK